MYTLLRECYSVYCGGLCCERRGTNDARAVVVGDGMQDLVEHRKMEKVGLGHRVTLDT